MNYLNKNIVCNNCGKYGHTQKQCNEPITSLGIICLKLNEEDTKKYVDELVHKDAFDINQNIIIDVLKNIPTEENILKFKNSAEYLIIQRKHSLGYIEFIRGRYDINNTESILHLILQMTPSEIECLKTQSFKDIWEEVWKKTSYNKLYIKEMEESMEKFNMLKEKNSLIKN